MARTYGEEYPERPRMSILSDLLSIPHFTTSNGSTVRRDFLESVADALGIDPESSSTKEDLLIRCIAEAQRAPIDPAFRSPGGTVTDRALQAMIDGISREIESGREDQHDLRVATYDDDAGSGDDLLGDLDLDDLADERTHALVGATVREGQDRFRTALMDAYGARCAMTGADAVGALEAAHVVPYLGPRTNRVQNGLLLRADLHRLFDRGYVSVHEETLEILLKPHLRSTTYGDLEGRPISVPRIARLRPAIVALRHQRLWAGL